MKTGPGRERVDKVLHSRGLAPSREKAQALIMAGLVYAGGKRVEKPGQRIETDADIAVLQEIPYASRGGLKLEAALDAFSISVKNKVAADLGASVGGFTDCLLQRGVKKVYAVDVDTRQLDWRLRNDPRVVLVEKNARYLEKSDFADPLDIVTMDLAFISVLKVLSAVKEFLGRGILLSLIKPQFEAGKGQVGKKGIIRDSSLHEEVLTRVIQKAQEMGFGVQGLVRSPIRGQRGNREFLVYWTLEKKGLNPEELESKIREVAYEKED